MENIKKQTTTLQQNQGVITFRHRCSSIDTSINFNALNWSLSDQTSTGIINPPAWVITASNLSQLKSTAQIITSAGRTLFPEFYSLTNSGISFINGFAPLEGEVFIFYFSNANRPTFTAEMQPIYRPGVILANATTYDFVDSITIPSIEARCPISVMIDGEEQIYGATGDFQFSALTNDPSKSRAITFTAEDYDRVILVTGIAWYQPNASVLPQIETLGGQVNRLVADVAVLANKELTDYQSAPNSVDLDKFGTLVNDILDCPISDPDNEKTYTESNAPISATNLQSHHARLHPYRTISKATGLPVWRLAGNIYLFYSISITASTVTISGVTFPSKNQAINVNMATPTDAYRSQGFASANTSTFLWGSASASNEIDVSFDLELASKPTWADDYTTKTIRQILGL
jgi:hypothetical protein